MDVFQLRDSVVDNYAQYVRSFVSIKDRELAAFVERHLTGETLWPEPLIQLNPAFEPGGWIDELVESSVLHSQCGKIFRLKDDDESSGQPMRLLSLIHI